MSSIEEGWGRIMCIFGSKAHEETLRKECKSRAGNDKPILNTYIGFEDMMLFELGQDLVFVIVVMNVQIPH